LISKLDVVGGCYDFDCLNQFIPNQRQKSEIGFYEYTVEVKGTIARLSAPKGCKTLANS